MLYNCLFYNGQFVIAKPDGWVWSDTEKEAPFSLHDVEMHESSEDYTVTVNGVELAASLIDWSLIDG